ncbi:MAG: DUF1482 family protein [Klebsiella oxytoca]|nr:DUF1482 family protein [Klebsiella oxytoca]
MSTMFALVITVGMLIGGNQDVLLGVYDSEKACEEAAVEQGVKGECLPLKGVLAEHPAGFTAQMQEALCRNDVRIAARHWRKEKL